MKQLEQLYLEMIAYYRKDPKRIQHFIKVHSLARLIGLGENIPEQTQFVLEAAAYVHDIGIKEAERKYASSSGKLQEQEGPALAQAMLTRLNFKQNVIDRVSYLVGHHHTYHDINGDDYQILVEADFLVNLYEDGASKDAVKAAYNKIFKTRTGKQLCATMFGIEG